MAPLLNKLCGLQQCTFIAPGLYSVDSSSIKHLFCVLARRGKEALLNLSSRRNRKGRCIYRGEEGEKRAYYATPGLSFD